MKIIKAELDQFQEIRKFYFAVIDGIGDARDSVGWKKDIYPAPEFLKESLENGELYIAVEEGRIVGAMVLNHETNDEYSKFEWPTQANENEVTVIHALGILPSERGKGFAKQMVRFAIEFARREHQKAIRLDVLKGNEGAKNLYSGMGFKYLHTLPMFYEDTGWTDFELYEYPII